MIALNNQGIGFVDGQPLTLIRLVGVAAGNPIVYVVPDWATLEVLNVTNLFTASAAVANRFPTLICTFNGDVNVYIGSAQAIVASAQRRVNYGRDLADLLVSTIALTVPTPRLVLPPATRMEVSASPIDAGDVNGGGWITGILWPVK